MVPLIDPDPVAKRVWVISRKARGSHLMPRPVMLLPHSADRHIAAQSCQDDDNQNHTDSDGPVVQHDPTITTRRHGRSRTYRRTFIVCIQAALKDRCARGIREARKDSKFLRRRDPIRNLPLYLRRVIWEMNKPIHATPNINEQRSHKASDGCTYQSNAVRTKKATVPRTKIICAAVCSGIIWSYFPADEAILFPLPQS